MVALVGMVFLLIQPMTSAAALTQTPSVVINEVAWMGTQADPNDEWMELYNTTHQPINLAGWKLEAADGTPSFTFNLKDCRDLIIPARGFLLLERTDDATVSDIAAACIYRGALEDGGEELLLKDATAAIIDTVNDDGDATTEDGGGWPAGDKNTRATMERIDPLAPDSDANWCTNDGNIRNGKDAKGNFVNGTPKAPNSCTPQKGDANGDGKINVIDARLCLRAALNLISLSRLQRFTCDLDQDGQLTELDAQRIAEISLGLVGSASGPASLGPFFAGMWALGSMTLLLLRKRIKGGLALRSLLIIGLMGLLSGCGPLAEAGPALLAELEGSEMLILAQQMPDGGLAALEARSGGLRFNPAAMTLRGIEPQEGWRLLAARIDNGHGEVRFAAVNPTEGAENGPVLRLLIQLAAGSSEVRWDPQALTLGSALDRAIAPDLVRTIVLLLPDED